MRKIFVLTLLSVSFLSSNAQIQVAKIVGPTSNDFTLGYGGFLKFSYQVSEPSDISLELSFLSFAKKSDTRFAWDVLPVKLGYRYVITGKGHGPYVEPQVGYNIYGIDPSDKTFKGFVWGAGVGYLFKPVAKIKFDLGVRFESASYSGKPLNYAMIRLSHNIVFGRKSRTED